MADDTEADIRQEISNIPLGQLQDLRQKVGTKKFDNTFQKHLRVQDNDNKDFKRTSKNRPREMSSKKHVSRFKQVIQVPKKEKRMDPRFDERCGHLNLDLFSKSFSFLEDVKKQERAQMETEARKTKDPLKKKKLETCLQKMESRDKSRQKEKEKKDLERQHKKVERKLAKEGKKPFFLSKALQRKALLVKRYKELKESGQLERVLRKRRKRSTAKERKRMLPRRSVT
ncbi:PREDICTED: ribosomal RNA processing protein 36 homolog isoform X1 [Amphimedon queenslandica]|nr:PREDICTED: ribosomal RNA processing protein 36 homolog isoform X1 [Amphimedon queenslandica]|eukprot:XP_019851811.1 PREDICTED: ribosomal RNA processing protein 36 homolog isoform X1 [Amphimedon queenslandica]